MSIVICWMSGTKRKSTSTTIVSMAKFVTIGVWQWWWGVVIEVGKSCNDIVTLLDWCSYLVFVDVVIWCPVLQSSSLLRVICVVVKMSSPSLWNTRVSNSVLVVVLGRFVSAILVLWWWWWCWCCITGYSSQRRPARWWGLVWWCTRWSHFIVRVYTCVCMCSCVFLCCVGQDVCSMINTVVTIIPLLSRNFILFLFLE